MKRSFSGLLVVVVVLGLGMGIAFGVGVAYARSGVPKVAAADSSVTNSTQQRGRSGQGGFGMGANGRPAVVGTITSVANGTLVVTPSQSSNGGQDTPTKVTVGDKTAIQKNVSGSVSDLKNGDRVIVSGSRGSDGSVAASTIQIMPSTQVAQ